MQPLEGYVTKRLSDEDNMIRFLARLQNNETFKLEPYLGFLHSVAKCKPSLICDFMELYRYLVDDFVIEYCKRLNSEYFVLKSEDFSTKRKGKREYLGASETHDFVKRLNQHFQSKVKMPRVRMGEQQEIETRSMKKLSCWLSI